MTRGAPDPAERPIWPGTTGPASGTPPRATPSWRRSLVVDGVFVDGTTELRARGQDVRTAADGTATVDTASTEVVVDSVTRVVRSASTDDPRRAAAIQALLGVAATASYRKALAQALPDDVADGALLAQLLDEPPGFLLVAAGSMSRRGIGYSAKGEATARLADICAGWQRGGDMLRAIEEDDLHYSGEGPWVGDVDDPDDPLAWPTAGPLPFGSVRRRRRFDVTPLPDGRFAIDALFRDSYVEPNGRESGVHEYGVLGTCDANGVILDLRAEAHVLPSALCPHAAASAGRLAGVALRDVRNLVRAEFTGTSTCTHLNDMLRSLGACWRSVEILRAPTN